MWVIQTFPQDLLILLLLIIGRNPIYFRDFLLTLELGFFVRWVCVYHYCFSNLRSVL